MRSAQYNYAYNSGQQQQQQNSLVQLLERLIIFLIDIGFGMTAQLFPSRAKLHGGGEKGDDDDGYEYGGHPGKGKRKKKHDIFGFAATDRTFGEEGESDDEEKDTDEEGMFGDGEEKVDPWDVMQVKKPEGKNNNCNDRKIFH